MPQNNPYTLWVFKGRGFRPYNPMRKFLLSQRERGITIVNPSTSLPST